MSNGYLLTLTLMDTASPLTENLPSRRRSNVDRLLSETTKENQAILSPPPPYRKKTLISSAIDDASDHIPLYELFLLSPSYRRRLRMDLENMDPHLPPPPRRRRKKRSLVENTSEITEMEYTVPVNTRTHGSRKGRVEDGKKVETSVPESTSLSSSGEGIFCDGRQFSKSSSLGFGFGLLSLLSYSTQYLDFKYANSFSPFIPLSIIVHSKFLTASGLKFSFPTVSSLQYPICVYSFWSWHFSMFPFFKKRNAC